jgi:hypothetical protein
MFERGVLIFSAIIWLPYGAYCFLQPGALADAAGVVATSPTGTTELRAMYGGLQMAIGALALGAVFKPRLVSGVLLALVFLTGGLASTRLLGVVIDGGFSGYTGGGLGFEVASCVLALVALSRSQPGAGTD